MKQFLFSFFLLSFLGNTLLFANQQGEEYMYNIQLEAAAYPSLEAYEAVKKYGFLHIQPNDEGNKRVMLGTYTSSSKAKEVLARVNAKGYPDAFVQKADLDPENLVYTVQLGSYGYTSGLHFTKYAAIDDLRVNASEGGVKLYAGVFYDKESAQQSRNAIKKKGHSCFVVQVNEGLLLFPSKHNFHSAEVLAEREEEKQYHNSSISSSKEYQLLSVTEQKKVIVLDGVLSIEHQGKLISLKAYQDIKRKEPVVDKKPVDKPQSSQSKLVTTTTGKTNDLPQTTASSEGVQASATVKAAPVIQTTMNDKGVKAPATAQNTRAVQTARNKAATVQTTQPVQTSSIRKEDQSVVQSRSTERPPLPPGLTARGVTVKNDFRIQVTAVEFMDPMLFRPLDPLGTFSIERDTKGITRVILGNYQSLSEARSILKEVQKQGYEQAFILVYENGFRTGRVE